MDSDPLEKFRDEGSQELIGSPLVEPVPRRIIGPGSGLGCSQISSNHHFLHFLTPFLLTAEHAEEYWKIL
jgi:hypothetical protein